MLREKLESPGIDPALSADNLAYGQYGQTVFYSYDADELNITASHTSALRSKKN